MILGFLHGLFQDAHVASIKPTCPKQPGRSEPRQKTKRLRLAWPIPTHKKHTFLFWLTLGVEPIPGCQQSFGNRNASLGSVASQTDRCPGISGSVGPLGSWHLLQLEFTNPTRRGPRKDLRVILLKLTRASHNQVQKD